jgi:16S rRNA (uracil1498-N3)-methyltransferase
VIRERTAFAQLIEKPSRDPELQSKPIHLLMSIIKGEAMEWVVEKAVELGVKSLTPIETEFCVIQTHKKGADFFRERWQKIADQTLKQCGRQERMNIALPTSLEVALSQAQSQTQQVLWLDESLAENGVAPDFIAAQQQHLNQTHPSAILVGPEGGFSPQERQRLLQLTGQSKQAINRVHLGKIILRAETAALFAVSLLAGGQYGKAKDSIQTTP